MTTPTSMPTASPVRIADQAPAPASSASATTGPRTVCAPCQARTTHSHSREENSTHPSRSSPRTEVPPSRPGRGVEPIRQAKAAAHPYTAAAAMSAQPGPTSTTTAPAAMSPPMRATLAPTASSALAGCRRSGGATSGMIPDSTGQTTAPARPVSTAKAHTSGIGAHPSTNIVPMPSQAIREKHSPVTITSRRG